MTEEELDAAIAEIIIPQEKPKSTCNSHRRKQWENKKYWHLCKKWKSCKFGKAKKCKLVDRVYNKLCEYCFCFQHRLPKLIDDYVRYFNSQRIAFIKLQNPKTL